MHVHSNGIVIGAGKGGESGDIAVGAIGVDSTDGKGDFHILSGEDDLGGTDFDTGWLRDFALIEFRTIAYPLDKGFMERAAFFEKFPTGVGDSSSSFGDK